MNMDVASRRGRHGRRCGPLSARAFPGRFSAKRCLAAACTKRRRLRRKGHPRGHASTNKGEAQLGTTLRTPKREGARGGRVQACVRTRGSTGAQFAPAAALQQRPQRASESERPARATRYGIPARFQGPGGIPTARGGPYVRAEPGLRTWTRDRNHDQTAGVWRRAFEIRAGLRETPASWPRLGGPGIPGARAGAMPGRAIGQGAPCR